MLREWNLFVQLVGEDPVSPPLEAEGEQGEAVDALSTWSPLPPPNYDLLTRRPLSSLSLEQLCAFAPPSLPLRRTQDAGSQTLRRTQDAGNLPLRRRTQDGGSLPLRRTQDGGSQTLRRTQDAGSQTLRRTQDAGRLPPNRKANDTSDPQRRLPASGLGSVKLLGSSSGGSRNEGPSTLASKLSNSAKRSVVPSEGPGGTVSGLSGRDLDRAKSDSSRFFGSTEKTEAPTQRFGGIIGDRTKLHSGSVDTPRSADVPPNTDMDSSSILDDFTELDLSNFSDFDDDDNDQAETDTNLKKTTDEHVVIDLTSEEASTPTPPPPDSDLTVGYGSDVELFDSIPVDVVELSGQEIISAGESSNTSRGPSGPTCQYNADQGIAVGDSTVKRNSTTSASDTECIDLHDYSNIDVDLFMKDSSSSSSDSDLPRIDLTSPATHRGKQAREKTKSPWKPCPLTTHPPSSSSEPHKKQLQFAAAAVSGNQGRFTSTAISTGSSQCARETETGTLNSDTAHRSNPAVTSLQDRETTTVHTAAAGASLWGEGEESVCGRSEAAGGLGNSSCPVCGYDYPPSFTQLLADEHMAVCLSVVDTDDW